MVYSMSQWILFGFLFSSLIFCYVSGYCSRNEQLKKITCSRGNANDLRDPSGQVTELEMKDMSIPRITSTLFSQLNKSSLFTVECSKCKIGQIEANAFSGMENLNRLILEDNKISSIGASWLKDIPNITTLVLNNNKIREIDDDAYQYLTKVSDLRISNNPLICLDLSKLIKLKTLYMDDIRDFQCSNAVKIFVHEHNISGSLEKTWNNSIPDTKTMKLEQNAKSSSSTVNVMKEVIFLLFLLLISKTVFIDHI